MLKLVLFSVLCFLQLNITPAYAQMSLLTKGELGSGLHAYGFEHDYQKALKILQPLADRGISDAQRTIGQMYEQGQGVKQDWREAYYWYSLAVNSLAREDDPSNSAYWYKKSKDSSATHLTADQIAAVEKRVQEWKPAQQPQPEPLQVDNLDDLTALANMPLDRSNICSHNLVLSWVNKVLSQASKIVAAGNTSQPPNFTSEGWQAFQKALQTATQTGTVLKFDSMPLFVLEGAVLKGVIEWHVRIRSNDENPGVLLTAIVRRATKAESPDGLIVRDVVTTPVSQSRRTPPKMDGAGCVIPSGSPLDPHYIDLEAVNFLIDVDFRTWEALRCHGQEDVCGGQFSVGACYKKELIQNYNGWPLPLRPENLTKRFVEKIKKEILPFVKHDAHCPEVKILTPDWSKPQHGRSDREAFANAIKNPKAVTIILRLDFDNQPGLSTELTTKPQAVALSLNVYRPGMSRPDIYPARRTTGVFPVNIPDDELEERLKNYMQHLFLNPTTSDQPTAVP